MSRGVIFLDRVAGLLVGLLLVAAGAAALLWWHGDLTTVPDRVDLSGVRDLTQQSWWPWATAAAGFVLIVLGLRWMTAHLPRRGVDELTLPGSDRTGRIRVSVGSAADAAADVLGQVRGVRSARGKVISDRGQLVASIDAVIEANADLSAVAHGADQAVGELRQALERDDLHARVQLKVASRSRSVPRVQ